MVLYGDFLSPVLAQRGGSVAQRNNTVVGVSVRLSELYMKLLLLRQITALRYSTGYG
jgi:hypothetical protein